MWWNKMLDMWRSISLMPLWDVWITHSPYNLHREDTVMAWVFFSSRGEMLGFSQKTFSHLYHSGQNPEEQSSWLMILTFSWVGIFPSPQKLKAPEIKICFYKCTLNVLLLIALEGFNWNQNHWEKCLNSWDLSKVLRLLWRFKIAKNSER